MNPKLACPAQPILDAKFVVKISRSPNHLAVTSARSTPKQATSTTKK